MKKLILFSICAGVIFFSGCDEAFNPKTEHDEEYLLTCLISCDQNYQTATITHTFDVDGYDPSIYDEDISIGGADIMLWYEDTVYVFKDSTLNDEDVTENNYKHFYYLENFNPEHNRVLELEATMPNGRKLHSTTITPSLLKTAINAWRGDQLVPPSYNDEIADEFVFYVEIAGDFLNSLYLPRFFFKYKKNENGVVNHYLKEVPLEYIEKENEYSPIYPTATNQIKTRFNMNAIDRAMQEISEGDPNKDNYTVYGAFVYVWVLDQNLSAYYGALQMKSDGFTVRVDVPEFSNVDNGFGIFGSYFEKLFDIRVLAYYPQSFGYRFESPEN